MKIYESSETFYRNLPKPVHGIKFQEGDIIDIDNPRGQLDYPNQIIIDNSIPFGEYKVEYKNRTVMRKYKWANIK